jgi:hypothetical protein
VGKAAVVVCNAALQGQEGVMSESSPTGYRESPDTTDGGVAEGMVDGTAGNDVADAGDKDTGLTTDDSAQREDSEARPGNSPD